MFKIINMVHAWVFRQNCDQLNNYIANLHSPPQAYDMLMD